MKCLNKFAAIVLSCVLLINNSNIVHAMKNIESANDVQTYNVPIISNEYPNSTVTFYGYDGKYYLSLEDIKDFTRCELDESDSQLTLTHGLREITIEKDTRHMTDSDFVDQGDIDIFEYDGKYLCEGIPMLVYLGAACTVRNDKALEVLMPSITIWESIMPDYLDYYFNVIELYGGENNVKISLALDIIADVLDGVSGHGLNANADTHLEDALYEILNVDMMKYESVQESVSEQNQKNQNFFTANADIILKSGESAKDAVATAIAEYAEFYFNVQIAKSEFKWQRAYQSGDLESASELSLRINQQFYNQSATKVNLEKADNALNIGMIAFNTAITSHNLMQYDDDTRNLFKRSINNEIFDYTDYHDISWNNVSDKISDMLSSNASIVVSSASKNVVDFINGEITKKGIEKALSGFTSKANIYLTAAQIGSFVASLINYKSNQAFSADMNAIWINTVQYDIAQLASRMLIKERDEYHFSDAESLNKLKDMFTLYYRTIIAFSENMAVSVDEFGGKNKKEWVQYFNSTSGKSVSNYAAIYLYRITNCTIVPIADYMELNNKVITSEWIEGYKNKTTDIFEQLPQEFVLTSGVGNWSTNIEIATDGTFVGRYSDLNMGDFGDEYPNGTIYICDFNGKFSKPQQLDEYTYSTELKNIKINEPSGKIYYRNKTKYICSEPYGFDRAKTFMIYLPGTPIDHLPDGFCTWLNTYIGGNCQTLPSNFYGLYNVNAEEGFGGWLDEEQDLISKTSSISSKTDLNQYLGTDIFSFIKMIGDMHDVGATDGSTEYSNGVLIVSAESDSTAINFISINGDCEYSIKGIEYGMSFENATKITNENCSYLSDDLPYYKRFKMNDGTSLSFHTEDGTIIDSVNLFAE